MRWLIIFGLNLLLLGCSTTVKQVSYERKTLQTNKAISINLKTGMIKGGATSGVANVGGVLIPIQTGEHPNLRFSEADQEAFVESLKNEVKRSGLVKVSDGGQDAKVDLLFVQTQHSGNTHRYLLDVVMMMSGTGKKDISKKYFIDSEEGVGTFAKMNTNASEGKTRAAQKLIDKLIPDIESYLRP